MFVDPICLERQIIFCEQTLLLWTLVIIFCWLDIL
jgi:hypothetical protein